MAMYVLYHRINCNKNEKNASRKEGRKGFHIIVTVRETLV